MENKWRKRYGCPRIASQCGRQGIHPKNEGRFRMILMVWKWEVGWGENLDDFNFCAQTYLWKIAEIEA